METIPLAKLRETFILRIWRDSAASDQWRCQVQSVRNGEVRVFQRMADAFAYIHSQLDQQEIGKPPRRGLH